VIFYDSLGFIIKIFVIEVDISSSESTPGARTYTSDAKRTKSKHTNTTQLAKLHMLN
jgi:hypothetical protein